VLDISVAICTWNRAKLLDQTLAEMRRLSIPAELRWELLVVNNNCSDATDQVIAKYAQQLPIRRLFEPHPGLSHARNCAVRAAAGALILWTDDDVLVDSNWIAEYVNAARSRPDAVYFGGTIEPLFPVEPPKWIRRNLHQLEGPYAVRQLGKEMRDFRPNEFPFGANMAFRTDVLKEYPFNVDLGPIKNEIMIRCDETDVIKRLIKQGYNGIWVGSARVQHYILPERLNVQYVWEHSQAAGRAEMRLSEVKEWRLLLGVPRWILRQYWQARLKCLSLALSRGTAWLRAYKTTAFYKGMLDEWRAECQKPSGDR
jgi:glycosyltransferase involved in cell wall biosynthesis